MRFDEINIIGEFKINGLTGSPGQALGLSGSEFTWITVSASSVIDAVGLTGTDYVICQSVNTGDPGTDAIENGNRLKSAYATASGLYVSNRVSVLITPGDYDFGATPLQLTTTNVDLIGMSSDASDVILRANGGSDYVLQIINSNTDTALCNVTLGTASLYSFDNSGTSSCYLRWDNVIATGNMFSDSNTSYAHLKGHFENVKVIGGQYIFYTEVGDIDGIFNNIEITSILQIFSFHADNGGIYGTYSNITINDIDLYSAFISTLNIIGYFENIKISNSNGVFNTTGTMSGLFKNIEIGDTPYAFDNTNGGIDGTFENIIVGSVSTAFNTTSANLTGTFSNIQIGNTINSFRCNTSGSISGSFEDMKIGDVSSNAFSSLGTMSGTFENITLGDCTTANTFQNNNIDGIFQNIEVGNFSSAFFIINNLTGTYSNLKFGDGSSLFSVNNNLNGYFENISCGDVGDFLTGNLNINGTFKNITTGLLGSSFRSYGETLDGYYENITLSNTNYSFISVMTMSGTFSNIQIGNVTTNTFYSVGSLTGTYENIKIGTCPNVFVSTTSDINGYFDTIEIGDVGNQLFRAGDHLYGTYKNIKMGDATGYTLCSTNGMDGIFENIELKNAQILFENNNYNKTGTFSNISAGTIVNAFESPNDISGYYKDMTFGTVSSFMAAASILSNTIIDNLKVNSFISAAFPGKIINSFVDARSFAQPAIRLSNGAIVERSKFLSDSGYPSINSGTTSNAQISFTITNRGITSSITNDIGTPLNINNPNIT